MNRAAPLAHVLRSIHGHRVLLRGTGQQGISILYPPNKRTFYPGSSATDIDDFLAVASSLHKCLQEKVDAARRRCLLGTYLAMRTL